MKLTITNLNKQIFGSSADYLRTRSEAEINFFLTGGAVWKKATEQGMRWALIRYIVVNRMLAAMMYFFLAAMIVVLVAINSVNLPSRTHTPTDIEKQEIEALKKKLIEIRDQHKNQAGRS